MIPTFLYPLFWLGALAVAAPIWLHLRRKATQSLVRFSAVQFLDDLPQARANPLRIQDPLLFLLRLLALLFLVAAFAWPYLPQDRPTQVSESRVYILDNTLSHRVEGGFERDRDQLLAKLRNVPADSQIAVVELTSLPRVLADFRVPRDELIARLEQLAPSFERGSYLAAFRQAHALLQQSLGGRRRIVLLADNQENQWTEATTVAPFLSNVELELPPSRSESLSNAALVEPRVRRLYLGNKSLVECEFKVYHQGSIRSAEIAIEAGGQEVVPRRKLKFTDDSPPTTTLVVQWEVEPRERVAGTLTLTAEEDRFETDNQAYFSLPAVREGKVAAVARSPFLRTALSPAVMQGRWQALVVDDLQGPEAGALRDAEVLVIESQFLVAPTGRELIDHYLSRGRGVMLLIDQINPPVQAYLRGHDLEFRSVVDQPLDAAAFRYVLTDHPIFVPFRSRDFGNLLDIRVHRYRRLAAPKARSLVYSQHGDVLLLETDRPAGKLLVSAFNFDRADTNWPLHPTFVPFLDLCLEYARAAPALQANFEPGERCVWSLPENQQSGELVVRSGDREWVRTAISQGRVEFRVPAEPGVYDVSFDGGKTIEHGININSSPLESELTYESADEAVANWKLPDKESATSTALDASQTDLSRTEILRQTLWWWLFLAGAALLALEMIWVGLRGRRISGGMA